MKCNFQETVASNGGERLVRCSRCGLEFYDTNPLERIHAQCRIGLGDIVAAGLEATGIAAAVRYVTGKRKCGGCAKRQNALNELGKQIGM